MGKTCRIADLRHKDVVNIKNGCCLGFVNDVEVDVCSARIIAIIIFGRLKCFGILGRHNDTIIKWENIEVIGEDTILVAPEACRPIKHRRTNFKNWFKF